MTEFTKHSFTVYPGRKHLGCVKEARDCMNYGKRCHDCVKVQGKYTNYQKETDGQQDNRIR